MQANIAVFVNGIYLLDLLSVVIGVKRRQGDRKGLNGCHGVTNIHGKPIVITSAKLHDQLFFRIFFLDQLKVLDRWLGHSSTKVQTMTLCCIVPTRLLVLDEQQVPNVVGFEVRQDVFRKLLTLSYQDEFLSYYQEYLIK